MSARTPKSALVALVALLAPAAAFAQSAPVSGAAAQEMVFAPDPVQVEMVEGHGLSEADASALQMVGSGQPYYGAIAISPDEGLMVEATVAAVNHHTAAAAEAAAIAGCEAKRKGKAACMVVARILPEGWTARDLTLSRDATVALGKDYKTPGALAVSPATGNFALAGSAEAALAACAEKAKTDDCVVAVQD